VGCGVIIESEGSQIVGVKGDPDHPANFGRLCTKGATLHLTASATVTQHTRLLQPMRRLSRHAQPGTAPEPVGWAPALQEAAERFAQTIRDHGPNSVGFYLSGQLLTEDYYVFNKIAKGVVGTNNVDTNSRLCMSSAVAGYKQTLGADAPPACYEDIDHAQLIFIAGSNTAHAHPILFRRIEDARQRNPHLKIVCADPRRTETATQADLHLPLLPGTDVMLFNGLLHLLLAQGAVDREFIHQHTSGFAELEAVVADYTPEVVAEVCGIGVDDLRTLATWWAHSPAVLSMYCQGLNQSASGTAKNAAVIHLHLATRQIGKPGAGPFSLTGQPNAMGGREVGGLANLLSAHRDMANPAHRAEVAALWGIAPEAVPATPGKTAVEMFDAAARGEIKALWIACTNPAQSMPDQARIHAALSRCDYVVVQEAFATTATCAYADLLLPATTWGEKEGTVTNSERRISRVRAAVPAAGQARHDWAIAVDFGQRLEGLLGKRAKNGQSMLTYPTPESVWNEHRESTRGRDLDITGLSYAALETQGPQLWPFPAGAATGQPRLYADGLFPTADGRARFVAVKQQAVAEPRNSRFPFSLNTGRLRDQWHGMSRTGALGRLFGHVPEPAVDMNPQDMARLSLADGDLVHVTSRRGSVLLPAHADPGVSPMQAFVAMHWGSEFIKGGINALTLPTFDPSSKQPELKHCAVKLLKADLPWRLLGCAWLPPAQAFAARERLRGLFNQFDFAACVPFGREAGPEETPEAHHGKLGVLFRAAAYHPVSDAVRQEVETLLGLSHPLALRYADRKRAQWRTASLAPSPSSGDTPLQGFLLAGDTQAEAWVKTLLQQRLPAQTFGRLLLAPGASAPGALAPASPQVCTCFNVSLDRIDTQLAGQDARAGVEANLTQLQAVLHCGTQCGSCLPALRNRIREKQVDTVAAV
jgi:assimilatory nitrate reductase catalytic subunit